MKMNIDLNNLPDGTRVKIVNKWRKKNGLQNPEGGMDKYLGETLTILKQEHSSGYILTEARGWIWYMEFFQSIKLPDSSIWFEVEYLEDLQAYIVGVEPEYYNPKKPEEIIPAKETEQKYMVFVSGKSSPKKIHDSYASAEKEAKRLSTKEVGYVVSIVKVEKQFSSKIIVEEIV